MRLSTLFIGVVAVVGVACSRIPVPVAPQVTNSPAARPSVEAPGESITVQSEAPHEEAPKPAFEPKTNPFVEEELGPSCEVDHRALVEAELVAYITHFLRAIRRSPQYRRRLSAALANVPVILDLVEADMMRHELGHLDPLDPLLIGVVISHESAWDYTAIGALGERGFMQVFSRAARGGFSDRELRRPENQLAAGVRFLRRVIDLCRGDVPGALTLYQTGRSCRPLARAVKRRWKSYQKALKLFRKEKNHEKQSCKAAKGSETENP